MMAHNLCYTTLLEKATIDRLQLVKDVDYVQTPNNGKLAGPFCKWITNFLQTSLLRRSAGKVYCPPFSKT
jgi:hypothetical protein